MEYFTLTIHNLPSLPDDVWAERVSAIAWAAGCSGIEEPQLPPVTPGLAQPATAAPARPDAPRSDAALPAAAQAWRIFFSDRAAAEACRGELAALLGEAAPGAPPVRFEIEAREPENWMAGWRDYFQPVRVGESFIIAPPWKDVEGGQSGDWRSQGNAEDKGGQSADGHHEARTVIRIEPGMAFGTGTHATTQLCLELAEPHLRPGLRVLDVGTGSGILAIAAARRGAAFVLALDNDTETIANFRLNVDLNGLALSAVSDQLSAVSDQPSAVSGQPPAISGQPSVQDDLPSFAVKSEIRSASGGPKSEIHILLSDGISSLAHLHVDLIFANLLAPHIETLLGQMRTSRFAATGSAFPGNAAPGTANLPIGNSRSTPSPAAPTPLLIASGLLADEWPALRRRWTERHGLAVEREVFRAEWMAFAGRLMP